MFGLTKQQQTFAIVIVLAFVAYLLFFRKKSESSYHQGMSHDEAENDVGEFLGRKTTPF
jgi:hypothetical protein